MNIFLKMIAMLLVIGCSTGSKESSVGEMKSDKMDSLTETEFNRSDSKKKEIETDPIEKEVHSKPNYSALEEKFENAMTSQSEDQMLSAGGELLAKNADDAKVLNGFATFYLRSGDVGAAKMFFERVLIKDVNNVDANNGMGVIAMKEGRENDGQGFFKKALNADDDHAEANANLGAYYLKYLDYEKAEMFLSKAYSEQRKNPVIANNYAIALRGVEKYDRALDVYKSIDSKNQKVTVLLNEAILLAEFKKDYREAKEILNKIRFITTDPAILKKANALVIKIDLAMANAGKADQEKK